MGNSKSHYRRLNGKTVASVEHSSSLPVSPVSLYVSSPVDSIGHGCPSAAFVHSFVRTDLVTTISHERLEQSR